MKYLKSVVDALFALAPDVVQEFEVAGLGYVVVLLNLHLSNAQTAAWLGLGFSVYLIVKGVVKAVEATK